MNVIIKIVLYVKNTIINDRIKHNKYILYCAVGTLFLFWHLFFCLVVVFVDFWKSVFLCYFLVNLCISLRKVRCISKFPIYRHLRRYLEGVGGEVEPSLPVWCKRTFFQKKKKNKKCEFCQVLCYGTDIYSDDCWWVFFLLSEERKKRKKPCADVCKSSQKSYKKSSLFIYFVFYFAIECHRI